MTEAGGAGRDADADADATVSFVKYDGSASWSWTARRIRTDQRGTWLFTAAGTPISKPGSRYVSRVDSVMLVPAGEHWVARYYEHGSGEVAAYADLVLPLNGRGDPSVIEIVDMDLDVYLRDGEAFLDDEDEFAENAIEMAYPADVADRIRATADALLDAARVSEPPFDRDPRDLVREARAELAE